MSERLTFQSLFRQLMGVFSLERGLIATVVDLSLRPGLMLRGYLDGSERHRYMGVIAYVVLMASIASALFVFFPPEALFAAMQADMYESPGNLDPEGFVELYRSFLGRYYQILVYLPVPLMAIATRWVLSSLGYNYVEHLVINGFAAAQVTLISIIGTPLLHIAGEHVIAVNSGVQLVGVGYGFWLLLQVGGRYTIGGVLRTLLAGAVGFMLIGVTALATAIAYAILNVRSAIQARELQMVWDAEAAEQAFQETFAALPVPTTEMQYALLLAQIGREDEALERAEDVLALLPNSTTIRHQYGIVQLFAGNVDRARSAMESVLELTTETTVYVDLCRIEAGLGNRERALGHAAAFERLENEDLSDSAELKAVLAYCYRLAGAPDDVARLAAGIDLSDAGTISPVGAAYFSLAIDDVPAAIAFLEQTIDTPVALPVAANVMYLKRNVFNDPLLEQPNLRAVRDRIGFR